MKKITKILALACLILLGTPGLSHASDVVKYNDSNLDDILIKNGIKVDANKVKQRREALIKQNPGLKPDLKVVEKVKENKPIVYPKTAVYGNVVDISEHQNPVAIDYNKFAKDIDGAILRSSITTFDEDAETGEKTYYLRRDLTVDSHYQNLNARNVPIGFYHYSRATNVAEATMEANYVLDYVRGKNVSLPIFLDMEDNMRQAKVSREELSSVASTFLDIMKRNGYVAGIYSYPHFAKTHLSKEVRNRGNFWIADYDGVGFTGYTDTEFDIWQYTHKGRVDGFSGNLDKNALYRDYPLLIKGKSRKNYDELIQEIIDGHWSFGKEREKRLRYAGYNYQKVQSDVDKKLRLKK